MPEQPEQDNQPSQGMNLIIQNKQDSFRESDMYDEDNFQFLPIPANVMKTVKPNQSLEYG